MEVQPETFAERLRAARHRAVLTQVELGERARVSESTIISLELGRRVPHPKTVRALARVLGVNPTDLVA